MKTRAAGPSVLVVDDEIDLCANMVDILGDLGFQVDTAQDGPTALELVRGKPYDIALLDLKMPGMDGLELYRRIKELRAGTIAIIVTAYANTQTAERALATGAWRVVAKPVDFRRLLQLVDQAIGQPLVLLVDDDRELCASLWDVLHERGYRVDLAHDEADALDLVGDRDFQVALIDVKLPSGSGGELLQKVRAASPGTRIILITAHRSEADQVVDQALREGAEAVCYKPFDIPHLLNLIDLTSTEAAGGPGTDPA